MTEMNLIKHVVMIENIACIYRNYSFLGRRMKVFAKLRSFITAVIYLCGLAHRFLTFVEFFDFLDGVNYYYILSDIFLSKFNSIATIILGFSNAQSFKGFVFGIDSVHKLCSHDVVFLRAMKKLHKRVTVIACLLFAMHIGSKLLYLYDNRDFLSRSNHFIIDMVVQVIATAVMYLECLAFYVFIEIIVSSLQYLNGSISGAVLKIRNEAESVLSPEDSLKLQDDIERWAAASRHLTICSDQLKSCFGFQIGVTSLGFTMYYIILLYRGFCRLTYKDTIMQGFNRSVVVLILLLSNFLSLKILILNRGQSARSEADRLRTAIAKLRVLLVGIPGGEAAECARAVSALARRLRAAPLRVRLCTGLAVQTSLLADILAIVANYTIILLQFNHVV